MDPNQTPTLLFQIEYPPINWTSAIDLQWFYWTLQDIKQGPFCPYNISGIFANFQDFTFINVPIPFWIKKILKEIKFLFKFGTCLTSSSALTILLNVIVLTLLRPTIRQCVLLPVTTTHLKTSSYVEKKNWLGHMKRINCIRSNPHQVWSCQQK